MTTTTPPATLGTVTVADRPTTTAGRVRKRLNTRIATLVSIDAGTVYGLTIQMMGVIFMIYVGMGTATSVRVRDGKRLVTDGPFAETREQLGGYYLIDARDLDEAMKIAERIPVAKHGTIEIRPVLEISGLPA